MLTSITICASISIFWNLQGGRIKSVQTGSMSGTVNQGDAVLLRPLQFQQLVVGDIVNYQSPINHNVSITHRIVSIDRKNGWLVTKGDSLQQNDPIFPKRLLTGRVYYNAPGFGRVMDGLRQPLALVALLYIPAVWIIANEIKKVIAAAGPHYRYSGYQAG